MSARVACHGRGHAKNETARKIPAPLFSKKQFAQYLRTSGGSGKKVSANIQRTPSLMSFEVTCLNRIGLKTAFVPSGASRSLVAPLPRST